MRRETYVNMKTARDAIVSVAMSLFSDKLNYGDDTTPFEERLIELLNEYDKIIDDYVNSDLIKDNN